MLGSIGILYFVLLICGIIEGALIISNKKINIYYVREAITIAIWVFFFAMIIHEITILKLDDSSYGNFISATYNYKFSLGGALFSIILYPLYKFCGVVGSFVILSCVLCIIACLFIVMIYQNIKNQKGDTVTAKAMSNKVSSALNSVETNNEDKKWTTEEIQADVFDVCRQLKKWR